MSSHVLGEQVSSRGVAETRFRENTPIKHSSCGLWFSDAVRSGGCGVSQLDCVQLIVFGMLPGWFVAGCLKKAGLCVWLCDGNLGVMGYTIQCAAGMSERRALAHGVSRDSNCVL